MPSAILWARVSFFGSSVITPAYKERRRNRKAPTATRPAQPAAIPAMGSQGAPFESLPLLDEVPRAEDALVTALPFSSSLEASFSASASASLRGAWAAADALPALMGVAAGACSLALLPGALLFCWLLVPGFSGVWVLSELLPLPPFPEEAAFARANSVPESLVQYRVPSAPMMMDLVHQLAMLPVASKSFVAVLVSRQ